MLLLNILLLSKSNWLYTIVIICVGIIIVALGHYLSDRLVILRALRERDVKKIKDFSDGDCGKIVGKVVLAGNVLTAPLSKRQCVFYHVIVEKYHHGQTSCWVKIIEEVDTADVIISDGTGYALIDAKDSMSYLVPDANYKSSSAKSMFPELQKILDRHNIDSKGFLGFSKELRCSEGILENGEIFVVAGEGRWNTKQRRHKHLPTKNMLVIVPGKEEKVFITDDPEASKESQKEQ